MLYLALPEGEEAEAEVAPAAKDVKATKEEEPKKSEKTVEAAAVGASLDNPSREVAEEAEATVGEVSGSKGHVVGFIVTLTEFTVEEFNDEFQVTLHTLSMLL